MSASQPPRARVRPVRRLGWAWLLPLAALAVALNLAFSAWGARGVRLRIRAEEGHGIAVGDAVRYRGITVGAVEEVHLAPDLSSVRLELRLESQASGLARAGSRFWIVRPRLGLDSVQGLETVVGARYLACLPGPEEAPPQRTFVALEEPPVAGAEEAGGLEIALEAPRRFGIAAGAPIFYRQISVGSVLSVALSSDATAVEIRALVRAPFAVLVREDTRFWSVGGFEVSLGLDGLRVELESLRTLFVGGISLSTPTRPGLPVSTGHRFRLFEGPEEEWLEWRPALPLGSELLPGGLHTPEPLRARLSWDPDRLFARGRTRDGWLLFLGADLVGPSDLLIAPEDADSGSGELELLGEKIPLERVTAEGEGPVSRWVAPDLKDEELPPAWSAQRTRALLEPEDCLVVADPGLPPRALAAAHLEPGAGGFEVDPSIAFDASWHGASVVGRSDGSLVGLLLVGGEGDVRVVPLLGPR